MRPQEHGPAILGGHLSKLSEGSPFRKEQIPAPGNRSGDSTALRLCVLGMQAKDKMYGNFQKEAKDCRPKGAVVRRAKAQVFTPHFRARMQNYIAR